MDRLDLKLQRRGKERAGEGRQRRGGVKEGENRRGKRRTAIMKAEPNTKSV